MKYVLLIVSVPLLFSCSNKSIYDAIQFNHQLECKKLIGTKSNSQYEDCINRYNDTYDEYTRKRTAESE